MNIFKNGDLLKESYFSFINKHSDWKVAKKEFLEECAKQLQEFYPDINILYVCFIGSLSFENVFTNESDIDIRFIYSYKETPELFSLEEPPTYNTVNKELDLTGYNLKNILKLLSEGNVQAYEIFNSNYYIITNKEFENLYNYYWKKISDNSIKNNLDYKYLYSKYRDKIYFMCLGEKSKLDKEKKIRVLVKGLQELNLLMSTYTNINYEFIKLPNLKDLEYNQVEEIINKIPKAEEIFTIKFKKENSKRKILTEKFYTSYCLSMVNQWNLNQSQ